MTGTCNRSPPKGRIAGAKVESAGCILASRAETFVQQIVRLTVLDASVMEGDLDLGCGCRGMRLCQGYSASADSDTPRVGPTRDAFFRILNI